MDQQVTYVRCISNEGHPISLKVGEVYRVYSREPMTELDYVVLDETYGEEGSEIGYNFRKELFEPVEPAEITGHKTKQATAHFNEKVWVHLREAAGLADKPVSALIAEWIEERLDLAETA